MREPLERRAKLFCKRELLLLRLSAERDAAVFVLTTILMRMVFEVGDFRVFPEKYSVLKGYRKGDADGLVLFLRKSGNHKMQSGNAKDTGSTQEAQPVGSRTDGPQDPRVSPSLGARGAAYCFRNSASLRSHSGSRRSANPGETWTMFKGKTTNCMPSRFASMHPARS